MIFALVDSCFKLRFAFHLSWTIEIETGLSSLPLRFMAIKTTRSQQCEYYIETAELRLTMQWKLARTTSCLLLLNCFLRPSTIWRTLNWNVLQWSRWLMIERLTTDTEIREYRFREWTKNEHFVVLCMNKIRVNRHRFWWLRNMRSR